MEQEKIKAAAIKRSDGIVSTGKHHAEIILASPLETCKKDSTQGFVTNLNRFVNRKEAAKIAFKAGQIEADGGGLLSEELWYWGKYKYDVDKGYYIPENKE